MGEWVALAVSIGICLAVGGLGAVATTPQIPAWYAQLRKPSWTPPDRVFGPVWTSLYVLMGFAAWLVWRHQPMDVTLALMLFGIQLALNLAWSFVFFAAHAVGWALVEVVALWMAVAATIWAFAPISTVAAWLLAPYLAWITYAASLNAAIWRLNRATAPVP
jgi:tryptophan-rich sensory protein